MNNPPLQKSNEKFICAMMTFTFSNLPIYTFVTLIIFFIQANLFNPELHTSYLDDNPELNEPADFDVCLNYDIS